MTPSQMSRLADAIDSVLRDYRLAIDAGQDEGLLSFDEARESRDLADELADASAPLFDEAPASLSKGPWKKGPTQLQRADSIRKALKELFLALAEQRERLTWILDEAQNGPPDGESDGTISEVQWDQLKKIEKALLNLLVSQLFDTRADQKA